MAVPDISRPNKIEGHMERVTPAVTTAVTLLTCPTDTIYRIRSISVYNTSTSLSANLRVQVVRNSVIYVVISQISLTLNTATVVLNGDDAFYLEPGDILQVVTSVANTLSFTCFYEVVK